MLQQQVEESEGFTKLIINTRLQQLLNQVYSQTFWQHIQIRIFFKNLINLYIKNK